VRLCPAATVWSAIAVRAGRALEPVTVSWNAWLARREPLLTVAVTYSSPLKPALGVIVTLAPLTLTVAWPWPGWALTSRLGLVL